MMEIPDRPLDKIAMDLVTDFTESSKGSKHTLTIRLINRLARSDTNPKQVHRHNHQGIHKTLPTQAYVPQVHTIRQWHGIQEPNF